MSQRNRSTRWRPGAVAAAMAVGMLLLTGGRAPAALRPAASDLDGLDLGTDWINTPGPLHARDLRGKIVLLDFWTFCCINCHHILPDLAMLEEKYRDELVVIGVHTPKFDAEKDADNVRNKVREYRIRHPVVNDANQAIWDHFEVSSWPTLVLIDPNGQVVGALSGEGHVKQLDKKIGELVRLHKARGDLDESPVRFFPEAERPHDSPLHYPGKILADPAGKRLFIADTGNNRIVAIDPHGALLKTIGSGATGLVDGRYDKAAFNRPQGMCLHDGTLYVADTENHAIRAVDLKDEQVRTVAGTGEQSHQRRGGGPADKTGLNSPWDVLAPPDSKDLYIAMAGAHQIWRLDLEAKHVGVWAGTGREDVLDGEAANASFAQPSGLASDGKHLFVADSEGSCVRAIALAGGHRVQTIVGAHDLPSGRSLFSFGDAGGPGPQARLQHCLGLAFGGGKLYIADTYNNKVKEYDPRARTVRDVAGSPRAEAGSSDQPPLFNQPGGLSVAGSTLYVADTDNHKVRTVDLSTGKVKTLAIQGLTTPRPPTGPPKFLNRTTIAAPPARVAPGRRVVLDVKLTLPPDVKLNAETPMPYLVEAPKHPHALAESPSPAVGRIAPPSTTAQVVVSLAQEARAGDTLPLRLSLSTFQCRGGSEGYCTIKSYVWTVPLSFVDEAPEHVKLTNVEPKAEAKPDK